MYFINGKYVTEEDAKIPVTDLAILRGFGVFEFLRTYQKKPFHLREHLARLRYSAEQIHLSLPYSFEEIEQIIHTLLSKSPFEETVIKVLLTGGASADHFFPATPSFIVFICPLPPHGSSAYQEGVTVMTTPAARTLPDCKTLQYLPGIVALQKNKDLKPKEALYCNSQQQLLEGVTSNFFAFKNGVLHTCLHDVLTGITREVVLQQLAHDLPISYEPIYYEDIPYLEEAFLTGTSKEIMPIVQIDTFFIGDKQVGSRTKELMLRFQEYTKQEKWPQLKIPSYKIP